MIQIQLFRIRGGFVIIPQNKSFQRPFVSYFQDFKYYYFKTKAQIDFKLSRAFNRCKNKFINGSLKSHNYQLSQFVLPRAEAGFKDERRSRRQ